MNEEEVKTAYEFTAAGLQTIGNNSNSVNPELDSKLMKAISHRYIEYKTGMSLSRGDLEKNFSAALKPI